MVDRPLCPRYEKIQAVARRFPQIDAQSLAAAVALLRLSSSLYSALDGQYARHGTSRGRFHVLMMLLEMEGEGLTPHQLAERAAVTKAAMTGLIDGLVKDGLVAREQDPLDRRSYRVALTPAGDRFLKGMLPDHFTRMNALVGKLTLEDKRQLVKLLEKVRDQLDVYDDAPSAALAR